MNACMIPDSWMQGMTQCPRYTHGRDLAVCVEGTGHSQGGSHENIHTKLDDLMSKQGLLRQKMRPSVLAERS